MPLLKGNLDPKRFNSTTLAEEWCNAQVSFQIPGPTWDKASEQARMFLIDVAQRVIDSLAAQGIVE